MLKRFLLVTAILVMLVNLTGCKEEEGARNNEEEDVAVNAMSMEEYNELSDNMKLRRQSQIKEVFGEPDAVADENGRTVWLYFDRVKNNSGRFPAIRFVFYTEADLTRLAENMGTDVEEYLEDNKGMVFSTTLGEKNAYKEKYGIK